MGQKSYQKGVTQVSYKNGSKRRSKRVNSVPIVVMLLVLNTSTVWSLLYNNTCFTPFSLECSQRL